MNSPPKANARRATGRRDESIGPANYRAHPDLQVEQPPHCVEAEQGLLGSILQSKGETIAECAPKGINEQHFYVPAHRTIYTALRDAWDSGAAIDLITFTQALRDRNLLESVGGAAYVTELFTFVPCAANIAYYIDIVCEKHALREIIAGATESVRRAYEQQSSLIISAKPVGVGAASQRSIPTGERSGSLTRIGMTESGSSCMRMIS